MEYVSRDTNEWFSYKFLSRKRILFLLVYYFIFYIYLAPNLSYQCLSLFLTREIAYQYAQFISDMLCMLPILYLISPLLKDSWNHFKEYPSKILWKGISLYLPLLFANGIIQSILIPLTGTTSGANQEAANHLFQSSAIVIALPAICIAPFVEEAIFRGIIFRELRKYGFWVGALVSGLSFGMLHCMGDMLNGNWMGVLFIFVYASMGIFMSLAYENSKNMYGAIFLHMFTNTIAVIAMAATL